MKNKKVKMLYITLKIKIEIRNVLNVRKWDLEPVVEEKLKSFLSPAEKEAMDAGGGEVDG